MDPSELLKNFSIDNWYKAFVYLGGIVLAFSLFVEVKGALTNSQVQLLSAGVFAFGLGEWKNHKHYSSIKPPNAYTGGAAVITKTIWEPGEILKQLERGKTGPKELAASVAGNSEYVKTLKETNTSERTDLGGILLDLIGASLFAVGIWKIVRH